MKSLHVESGKHHFVFSCESRGTRSGFAHDCTLFTQNVNDYIHTQKAHCYYLNRTWEAWNYQSVCLTALDKEISDFIACKRVSFMSERGYKRMTAARHNEFKTHLMGSEYFRDLIDCKAKLRANQY